MIKISTEIHEVLNKPGVLAALVPGTYSRYDFVPSWMPLETGIDAYDRSYVNANASRSETRPATQDENQSNNISNYQLNMDDTPTDPILELLDF